MAIRLTLLCHARLAGPRGAGFPADDPVDAAALPSSGLAPGRYDRLLTAPELRARQTAQVLGEDAAVTPALRDLDCGVWQGRSLDEIFAGDPDGASSWLACPDVAPHGGESITLLLQRVGNWLDAHEAAGHTMAVTHPAVIRAAVVHCFGAPPQAFWRLDVEPLSAADLRRNTDRWTLRSICPSVT
jgi:broad specificity phosphatase PhoE